MGGGGGERVWTSLSTLLNSVFTNFSTPCNKHFPFSQDHTPPPSNTRLATVSKYGGIFINVGQVPKSLNTVWKSCQGHTERGGGSGKPSPLGF